MLTYGPGLRFLWKLTRVRWSVQRDPASKRYTDVAIAPAVGGDDGLEMYQATKAARIAVGQARKRADAIRAARGGRLELPRLDAADDEDRPSRVAARR